MQIYLKCDNMPLCGCQSSLLLRMLFFNIIDKLLKMLSNFEPLLSILKEKFPFRFI